MCRHRRRKICFSYSFRVNGLVGFVCSWLFIRPTSKIIRTAHCTYIHILTSTQHGLYGRYTHTTARSAQYCKNRSVDRKRGRERMAFEFPQATAGPVYTNGRSVIFPGSFPANYIHRLFCLVFFIFLCYPDIIRYYNTMCCTGSRRGASVIVPLSVVGIRCSFFLYGTRGVFYRGGEKISFTCRNLPRDCFGK